MVYSWVEGINLFSAAFGSLGVVYFIALFYFRPQKGIAKAIGDMAQLQTLSNLRHTSRNSPCVGIQQSKENSRPSGKDNQAIGRIH